MIMNKIQIIVFSLLVGLTFPAAAQGNKVEKKDKFFGQTIDVGTDKELTREESTAAVSVITSQDFDHRSAKNIGNSILGQGNGLVSLQNNSRVSLQNPTFYVRGLQTLNRMNAPLILVDGIERDITSITAEEVESVSVLKDAAAVALYGYKGTKGAILITTKRGKYNKSRLFVQRN